jgi:hypothetical protein
MANYYSSRDSKGYRLRLYVAETDVNTTNNTSKVNYTLYMERNGNYSFSTSNNTITVSINGTQVVNKKVSINMTSATSVTLATGTTSAIAHNTDGSKSVSCTASYTPSSSAYYMPSSKSLSGTLALTTIARASVPTVTPSTFNIGDTIIINTNRKSTAFTHTITLYFGNYSYQIGTDVTDTITFDTSTIANNMYQQIPNASVGVGNVTAVTYNGSTNIGSNQALFYANVTNSSPTFATSYLDTKGTTTAITGNNQKIIRNNSTLQVKVTGASAKNYATLSSATVELNGTTYTASFSGSSATFNIGTVNLASNTTAVVTVTDSRGISTSKDLPIIILDWVLPTAIITLERQNNYYSETDINVNAEYSSLDGENTITIKTRYKKTTDSTYGSYTTLQDNVTSTLTLDNNYAWDVQVLLTDRIGSTTYNLNIDRGMPIFYIDRLKRSVGINCFPQNNESLEVNEEDILNRIAGYGQIAKQVTGDWNTACGTASGFYMGENLSNAPTGQTVANWWWVIHIAHNNLYQRQIAYSLLSDNIIYTRIMNNGTWSAWENISAYYSGDTMSGSPTTQSYIYTGGGFVTSGGKSVQFNIPIDRPTSSTLADVTISLVARQNANYIVGSATSGTSFTLTNQNVSGAGIHCEVSLSTAPTGVQNNSACGIALYSYSVTFR